MKEMSIEGRVEAHASMDIQRYINDFDLVMIAPHLQYLKSEIEEICEKNGKKAVFVPSQSYGSMDGVSIMNFALEIMKEES